MRAKKYVQRMDNGGTMEQSIAKMNEDETAQLNKLIVEQANISDLIGNLYTKYGASTGLGPSGIYIALDGTVYPL
jgi:hypothetical protein